MKAIWLESYSCWGIRKFFTNHKMVDPFYDLDAFNCVPDSSSPRGLHREAEMHWPTPKKTICIFICKRKRSKAKKTHSKLLLKWTNCCHRYTYQEFGLNLEKKRLMDTFILSPFWGVWQFHWERCGWCLKLAWHTKYLIHSVQKVNA